MIHSPRRRWSQLISFLSIGLRGSGLCRPGSGPGSSIFRTSLLICLRVPISIRTTQIQQLHLGQDMGAQRQYRTGKDCNEA